jgi:hypothetical protein
MHTSQASTRRERWGELLLGGAAAGVGAPLLLGGLRRVLRLERGGSPASVGWAAGVLGALVARGLARRRLPGARGEEGLRPGDAPPTPRVTEARAGVAEDAEALALDWRREARRRRLAALEPRAQTPSRTSGREGPGGLRRELGPRRGPSGREQPWHEAEAWMATSG